MRVLTILICCLASLVGLRALQWQNERSLSLQATQQKAQYLSASVGHFLQQQHRQWAYLLEIGGHSLPAGVQTLAQLARQGRKSTWQIVRWRGQALTDRFVQLLPESLSGQGLVFWPSARLRVHFFSLAEKGSSLEGLGVAVLRENHPNIGALWPMADFHVDAAFNASHGSRLMLLNRQGQWGAQKQMGAQGPEPLLALLPVLQKNQNISFERWHNNKLQAYHRINKSNLYLLVQQQGPLFVSRGWLIILGLSMGAFVLWALWRQRKSKAYVAACEPAPLIAPVRQQPVRQQPVRQQPARQGPVRQGPVATPTPRPPFIPTPVAKSSQEGEFALPTRRELEERLDL